MPASLRKARKPRGARMITKPGGAAHVSQVKPKRRPPSGRDPKPPNIAPKPSTPAVPPDAIGPPETLRGAAERINSSGGYNLTMAEVNRRLMEAAMRYGGAPTVQQFGLGPEGQDISSVAGVTTNPGDASTMSTITRNLGEVNKHVDQSSNAQNTFFSSKRIGDLQENSNEAARARQQALAEYQSLVSDLVSQLLGARGERDAGHREANIMDIEAAQQLPPPAATPQAGPPAAPAKPKKGFKFVQSSGPRKGMSYNLVPGPDGKLWRRYEDGKLIPR